MMHGKKIIAVLPAYNAEKTLSQTVEAIPRDIVDEIILGDDASTDGTYHLAQKLGLTTYAHKKNQGYGANQKTCYKMAMHAGADIIVMVHPDFQYDPASIPELVSPIACGETNAVFGSRMLIFGNALAGGMPVWKYLANIFLTTVENFILRLHLSEYHSGFRAYSKKVFETVPYELNSNGFVFDTEIIVQMKLARLTIQEIPIATRYFPEASMIGLKKSVQYGLHILWTMMRYVFHRSKIKKLQQFSPLFDRYPVQCIQCHSHRVQVWKNATTTITSSCTYLITESCHGRYDTIFICISCDCRFVDRKNSKELLQEQYIHQPLDKEYLKDELWRRKSFRRIFKKIQLIPTSAKKNILDIGCGPGLLLSEMRKEGFNAYGIDMSHASIEYAQNIFHLSRAVQGRIQDIDTHFPDAYFDVISAIDVFEHIFDPSECMAIAHKKLKDDGVFCMTLLMGDSFFARLSGNAWYALLPSHLQYYSKKSASYLCSMFGFEYISQHYHIRYLSVSYLLQRLFKNSKILPPAWLRCIGIPIIFLDTIVLCLKKKKK